MTLKTKRLILRPWEEDDAEELFRYAKDPQVGPVAGWQVHKSIQNSKEIIRDVLSAEGTFAVVLKETGLPVGSIGIMQNVNIPTNPGECEIGYWIGKPYWGRGLIPEAANELIRYCFENLNMNLIWCGYYDGNEKSKRVSEKCGFKFHHTNENVFCTLMGDVRVEHITYLDRGMWEKNNKLRLIKCEPKDLNRIDEFYKHVIDNTDTMPKYARWVYGQHPTHEQIAFYVDNGFMYYVEKDGIILGAVAVAPFQDDDYEGVDWQIKCGNHEVSTVHLLAVNPDFQRQGIAKRIMLEVKSIAIGNRSKAVRLDAISGNTPAHSLYGSMGYARRGICHWYAENVGWTDFLMFELLLNSKEV